MTIQRYACRRSLLTTAATILITASVAVLGDPCLGPAAEREPGIYAGAAQRDISPPVGLEITHYVRKNIGVHDPLFARALVLEDVKGTSVAIITADLIGAGFTACDEVRERVKQKTGVSEVTFSSSHSHAARWLVPTPVDGRERTDDLAWDEGPDRPITDDLAEVKWNRMVHQAVVKIVVEAQKKMVPVTLRAGRAVAQVGFNRRITHPDGYTYMGVNRKGPVVPWVNVLVANARGTEKPVAVLFEHAAHPVTVTTPRSLYQGE